MHRPLVNFHERFRNPLYYEKLTYLPSSLQKKKQFFLINTFCPSKKDKYLVGFATYGLSMKSLFLSLAKCL